MKKAGESSLPACVFGFVLVEPLIVSPSCLVGPQPVYESSDEAPSVLGSLTVGVKPVSDECRERLILGCPSRIACAVCLLDALFPPLSVSLSVSFFESLRTAIFDRAVVDAEPAFRLVCGD